MFAFASSNESTHLSITWTPVSANIQFSLSLIYPKIGVMQSRMGKDQRQIIIIRCKFAFDKYAAHCATLTFSPWHEIGTSDKACVGLSLCFFIAKSENCFGCEFWYQMAAEWVKVKFSPSICWQIPNCRRDNSVLLSLWRFNLNYIFVVGIEWASWEICCVKSHLRPVNILMQRISCFA